jgi:hypothetical protein
VPTPLAATRLVPPDSLMAALDAASFQQHVAASPFVAKYGTPIDRQSAHEIITARIAAARAAATAAAQQAGVPPAAGAPGEATMTVAQQEREIARQARDQAKEMARQQRAQELARRQAQREAAAAARQRDRMVETGVRTAGRVLTSKSGQSLLRGVFGTLFGGR